jgi:hypothetical protein
MARRMIFADDFAGRPSSLLTAFGHHFKLSGGSV